MYVGQLIEIHLNYLFDQVKREIGVFAEKVNIDIYFWFAIRRGIDLWENMQNSCNFITRFNIVFTTLEFLSSEIELCESICNWWLNLLKIKHWPLMADSWILSQNLMMWFPLCFVFFFWVSANLYESIISWLSNDCQWIVDQRSAEMSIKYRYWLGIDWHLTAAAFNTHDPGITQIEKPPALMNNSYYASLVISIIRLLFRDLESSLLDCIPSCIKLNKAMCSSIPVKL